MEYRLKNGVADFTVVDGAMQGCSFKSGKTYTEIPPQEKDKFEVVFKPLPPAPAAVATTEKDKHSNTEVNKGGKK